MSNKARLYLLGLGAILFIATGCAAGDGATYPVPLSPSPAAGDATSSSSDQSSTQLNGLLATTDLSVGTNRISFLLTSPDALITAPEATVTAVYLPENGLPGVPKGTATARFFLWPFGTRGGYVTQLSFDKVGAWRLDIQVQDTNSLDGVAQIPLEVKKTSIIPAIGSRPPLIRNKTQQDVLSLKQLTSWSTPDPELYEKTISEALASGQPLMVVFSSPAFCTSPTCGPQVEAVQQVKEKFRGQANFIHVEVYDNPAEIQGNLDKARYAPVVEAWNLPSIEGYLNESWVFIMDLEGHIASKYEGFASEEELEAGLLQVLG